MQQQPEAMHFWAIASSCLGNTKTLYSRMNACMYSSVKLIGWCMVCYVLCLMAGDEKEFDIHLEELAGEVLGYNPVLYVRWASW